MKLLSQSCQNKAEPLVHIKSLKLCIIAWTWGCFGNAQKNHAPHLVDTFKWQDMYFRLANEHLLMTLIPTRATLTVNAHMWISVYRLKYLFVRWWCSMSNTSNVHCYSTTADDDGFVFWSTEYSSGLPLWIIFQFNPSQQWIFNYQRLNYPRYHQKCTTTTWLIPIP